MIKNFKIAFTLAEVLIVIGIIGIVAAITMPSLMHKIQHKILLNQFKKAYSAISQTILEITDDHEGEFACYYTGFGKSQNADCGELWLNFQRKSKNSIINSVKFKKDLKRYKEQEEVSNSGGYVYNRCSYTNVFYANLLGFELLDGTTFYTTTSPFFILDINGAKGPNKWGYDAFYATFVKDPKKPFARPMLGESTCYLVEKGGYSIAEMVKQISK